MFKKYSKGLVIGKFMPFHKGHEYLINFAKEYCEHLFVIVDCLKDQTIDPITRKTWIESTIPNITVIALDTFMPQDPSECSDFWDIWRNAILSRTGKIDVLVAAMDYGWKLSQELNCETIILDVARNGINISATEIRHNTFKHWNYLTNIVKQDYVKKICLIGPESTGKSTISKKLAQKYETVFVPEFAINIINHQNGNFYENNIIPIIQGQLNSEKNMALNSNKIMFCDSDFITTLTWAKFLFNYENLELEKFLLQKYQNNYDITFLLYPDTKWVHDTHRNVVKNSQDLEFRLQMFHMMEQLLIKFNRKYIVLKGDYSIKEQLIHEYIHHNYSLFNE